LIINRRIGDIGPVGLFHREPVPVGFQPPIEKPLRLLLLGRNHPDDVFV